MDHARVYSYLRFSDPKQATGSSIERQTDYARRWAAERGLMLDEALSMRDEGLSAYHQRHVTQGALGAFLAAIDEGRIAPGSVLIVEGLDRLSRAEPIQAQAQLAQIVNAGITVVTASDGREYNRERLKAQPMDLVYSLLVMIRAHEESDTKSRRVRAAIRRQCEGWRAGTWRGVIRNGKDPAWVRIADGRFELVPERAEAVRVAVELFRLGEGAVRILRELERRGLRLTEGGSGAANLYKMFRLPALIGTKRIALDGEAFELQDYYPALISRTVFDELRHLIGQRMRRRGRAQIPGIVTGLGLTWCGYCGAAMVGQNLMGRARKPDGAPQDGHRRMICCGHAHGSGCSVGGSCSVVPVERALLTYCSDQMNLSALTAGDVRTEGLRADLARTRSASADVETKLARVTAALLDDGGPAPAAFARKARELEAELAALQATGADIERALAASARSEAPTADRWAALAVSALSLDEGARLQVRQMVADTFERIVVFHRGVDVEKPRGAIDVLLVAKGGGRRMLAIDRRSGALLAGEDLAEGAV